MLSVCKRGRRSLDQREHEEDEADPGQEDPQPHKGTRVSGVEHCHSQREQTPAKIMQQERLSALEGDESWRGVLPKWEGEVSRTFSSSI
jgi:hypothetical protein